MPHGVVVDWKTTFGKHLLAPLISMWVVQRVCDVSMRFRTETAPGQLFAGLQDSSSLMKAGRPFISPWMMWTKGRHILVLGCLGSASERIPKERHWKASESFEGSASIQRNGYRPSPRSSKDRTTARLHACRCTRAKGVQLRWVHFALRRAEGLAAYL